MKFSRPVVTVLAAVLAVTAAPTAAFAADGDATPTPVGASVEPIGAGAPFVDESMSALVPTAPALSVTGETVTLRGTVVQIGAHGDGEPLYVLEVGDLGLVPIDGSIAADAVGKTGDFTFTAAAPMVAAMTDGTVGADVVPFPEGLDPASPRGQVFALSQLTSTAGALAPAEFTPIGDAIDLNTTGAFRDYSAAAVFGSNRAQAKSATHKVWAVPMSANSASATSDQSSYNIGLAVDRVSDYWSDQSNGKITFDLQATISHKPVTNNWPTLCHVANFSSIINYAYYYAYNQGYRISSNKHMVVVFPEDVCSGMLGLGSVGKTVNSGGYLWTTGTIEDKSKAVLAHELGHNLSLGHANQLTCATPSTASVEYCASAPNEYYDIFDVMGFGIDGSNGGMLSSPNAIDAGLWTSSEYYVAAAGSGEQTFTINVVSSTTGRRAIAVKDVYDGSVFYVEARSLTGEDADVDGESIFSSIGLGEGVRILQLEKDLGYETYLIPRPNGTSHYYFGAGHSYTSPSGAVTISVTSVDDASATVEVNSRAIITQGTAGLTGLSAYGQELAVDLGEDWGSFLSGSLDTTVVWKRGTKKIKGETGLTYTTTTKDIGKKITAVVTFKVPGYGNLGAVTKKLSTDSKISKLPITAYPVTITGDAQVGEVLEADTTAWTPGIDADPVQTVTMKYQWYRGSKAIKGAKSSTYTLTSKDKGKKIRVKVTGTSTGYATEVRKSEQTVNVLPGVIETDPAVAVSHDSELGKLTAATSGVTTEGVKVSYQWYRGTKKLDSATKATYNLKGKDAGQEMRVRVTFKKAGYTTVVVYSTPTIYS